jgi:hypothetical protein
LETKGEFFRVTKYYTPTDYQPSHTPVVLVGTYWGESKEELENWLRKNHIKFNNIRGLQ